MAHVPEVQTVEVFRYQDAGGEHLLVHAAGEVECSGWSGFRLAPRFYRAPPADGLWEFDFEADAPCGPVLPVVLPATAEAVVGLPGWLRGVKVYAAAGSETATRIQAAAVARYRPAAAAFSARPDLASVRQVLVSHDDLFSPAGYRGSTGHPPSKYRHHALTMTVTGPDEAKIRRCMAEAAGAGLVAAAAAAYPLGGGALFSAVSALLGRLHDSLGDPYNIRVDDRAQWLECTA